MNVNSRTKGKVGELEACRALEGVTTLQWERTAQRWGAATADLWTPEKPNLGVHVEVKRYADKLAMPTRLADKHRLVQTGDDLFFCRLQALRQNLIEALPPYFHRTTHNTIAGFMRQAARDKTELAVPLVVMRQDHAEWLCVWRYQDDDLLRDRLTPYLKVTNAK